MAPEDFLHVKLAQQYSRVGVGKQTILPFSMQAVILPSQLSFTALTKQHVESCMQGIQGQHLQGITWKLIDSSLVN